jgi:hypothetical protein
LVASAAGAVVADAERAIAAAAIVFNPENERSIYSS